MSKILVIVESPSKCKKIEEYLGKDEYKCLATFGHLREMKTSLGLKCINFETFEIIYQDVLKQKSRIQSLKREIKNSKYTIIATDDDREGEAIGWHICELFNLSISNTKRIIFNEITKPALQKAIKNPTTLNMNMILSQQSRQIIDLIIGYSISPLLWKYIQFGKSSLSAGRCQTPALKIIYDNYIEILNSELKFVHSIYCQYNTHKYTLSKTFTDEHTLREFLEKNNKSLSIINSIESEIEKKQPDPLITSTIQQKSHYSPKQTMSICQNLYEAGYITYMRTDNKRYSHEFISNTLEYIEQHYGNKYLRVDDIENISINSHNNSATQEAHEAIRPTEISLHFPPIKGKITEREQKIYTLIRNITLASCMSNAKYMKYKSVINTDIDDLYYSSILYNQIFNGWQCIERLNDSDESYHNIFSLKNGSKIEYERIWSVYNSENNKQHINESKLVSILEKKGIGRPSTYASIVDKIQERGYVSIKNIDGNRVSCCEYSLENNKLTIDSKEKVIGGENNKLVIQPIGIITWEFLNNNCKSLFEYTYTSEMEERLDEISKCNRTKHDVCNSVYDMVKSNIDNLSITEKISFKIDECNVVKFGKYGPIIEHKDEPFSKSKIFPIKKELDLEKLINNEYSLDELVETDKDDCIGEYKDKPIYIKSGKFGKYAVYNDKNYSLKKINITLENIIKIISSGNKEENILRVIDINSQLRKGNYGNYIYYKSNLMKKPKFIPIKREKHIDFTEDSLEIIQEWIQKQLGNQS